MTTTALLNQSKLQASPSIDTMSSTAFERSPACKQSGLEVSVELEIVEFGISVEALHADSVQREVFLEYVRVDRLTWTDQDTTWFTIRPTCNLGS